MWEPEISTEPPVGDATAVTVSVSPSASVSFAAGLPVPVTGSERTVSSVPANVSGWATGAFSTTEYPLNDALGDVEPEADPIVTLTVFPDPGELPVAPAELPS